MNTINTTSRFAPITRPSHRERGSILRFQSSKAPDVEWPTGLVESIIVDGFSTSRDHKKAIFGLGAHLRNQGISYYDHSDLINLLPSLENYWQEDLSHHSAPSIPSYAAEPFHVWRGHSNWPAAANSEAVMSMFAYMALNNQDQKSIGNQMKHSRHLVMARVMDTIKHMLHVPIENISLAVDLGCGTAQPTNLAAAALPNARVLGIDISPFMISWAKMRNDPSSEIASRELSSLERSAIDRVELRRGLAEDTGLRDGCADVVMLLFVAHELPLHARRDIFREAHRILKPGGVFAVVDHTQEGAFPWRVFDAAKQTGLGWMGDAFQWFLNVGAPEPWLRVYYENVLEDTLKETLFEDIEKVAVTQWQHAVVAKRLR